jgi:hypothetical protein
LISFYFIFHTSLITLVNPEFVELERLGNISWSEAVFGESGVIEFCQIELTSIGLLIMTS